MEEDLQQGLKEKWVSALRSGSYQQTSERLECNGAFCCLGVLCDVAQTQEWDGHVLHVKDDDGFYYTEDCELPSSVRSQLGIGDTDCLTLMEMNDGNINRGVVRHSFQEIADYIEANI